MSERVNPPPFIGFPQRNPYKPGSNEYRFFQSLISSLNQQRIIIEQLWRRTGGGADDVSDGQTRELFAWSQGAGSEDKNDPIALFGSFDASKDAVFFSVSSAHTTAGNEFVEATASITVTLNQYPEDGERVTVKRNTTAGNVTISGNGNNINDASTYVMALNYEGVALVYSATSGVWLTS